MTSSDEEFDSGTGRMLCFSQGNPVGKDYWDVPGLLRRVADSIEEIPDIRVQDLVFHSLELSESEDLHITVYFSIASEEEKEQAVRLGRHYPGDRHDEPG
jgi:hypothetical protein